MWKHFRWRVAAVLLSVVAATSTGVVASAEPGDSNEPAQCAVSSGRSPERAAPEAAGVDSDKLAAALAFAGGRNRLNIQVYRNNCLIGEGPANAQTGKVPWNIWSATKSVVSLLAGIAWDQGRLDIDAPIDRYLPPGLGAAEHRAITVENLLTETSGLRLGLFTEAITGIVPIEPNSAVQALGLPLDHAPGTTFGYSQRSIDLLAYVTELAVGEPLQQFAQRELFDPLGIARTDYYWARDRSGNTYGYAHLLLPPDDLAKLGLLVSNDGAWGATQVISEAYLAAARRPSPTNPCYGYLFWLGPDCAESPSFMPPDTYTMSGFGMQNNFVVPSLGLLVSWTGAFGNASDQGLAGAFEDSTELTHYFFRMLFDAFDNPPVPDPGPYVPEKKPMDLSKFIDPDIALAVFGAGPMAYPGCTVLSCLNIPMAPPFSDAPPGCAVVTCLGPDPRTPGIR